MKHNQKFTLQIIFSIILSILKNPNPNFELLNILIIWLIFKICRNFWDQITSSFPLKNIFQRSLFEI